MDNFKSFIEISNYFFIIMTQYLDYLEVLYLVSQVTSCKEVQYQEYLELLYLVSQVTGWW